MNIDQLQEFICECNHNDYFAAFGLKKRKPNNELKYKDADESLDSIELSEQEKSSSKGY